jgi:hypothetical protein
MHKLFIADMVPLGILVILTQQGKLSISQIMVMELVQAKGSQTTPEAVLTD